MENKVNTNENGIANITYTKSKSTLTPIYVSLVGNPYYNSNVHFKLNIDTYPRLKSEITNKTIGTTHYNEPCTLNCTVKDEYGNGLSGYQVNFRTLEANIKTPVTDNKGYAEVQYTPTTGSNFKYICKFSNNDIYAGTEATFTVTNDKQTPLVTIKKSADTLEYGDTLKITTGLMESAKAIKPNNPIKGEVLGIYYVPESNNGNITYSSTPKTSLKNVTTPANGTVLSSFTNLPVGQWKIYAVYWGDARNTDNESIIYSKNSLYHWAWNYCIVYVNPRTVSLEGDKSISFDGASFGNYQVKLFDKNAKALSNMNMLITVKNKGNNKSSSNIATTNSSGVVAVDFVKQEPSKSVANTVPIVCDGWNIGNSFEVTFSFNTDSRDNLKYTNYGSSTFKGEVTFKKANTSMISYPTDDELKVVLSRSIDGVLLKDKNVVFTEGNVNITKKTNDKGEVTLLKDDVEGGEHTFTVNFNGDAHYNSSQITAKWTNVIIDDCTTLATFTTYTERWYASSENRSWYRPSRWSYDRLRYYCNEVYNTGTVDEEDGVHARTGTVIKCNNLVSNGNCDITFKLKFVTKRGDGGFGGHFGLMAPDATSAELAPARFEVFNNPGGYFNKYFIHGNANNQVKSFKMSFKFDTPYNMVFMVRGKNVTCKNLDTGEQYTGNVGKYSTVGLQPYIMVYLNYCEMIIRELKLELK